MRYAAFLRAINVGSHNRVRMDVLRELCASLGFSDVVTYLQTGNLAFSDSRSEDEVTRQLDAGLVALGLRNAPAIVRSRVDIAELMELNPFVNHDSTVYRRYVTFLQSTPVAEVASGPRPGFDVVAARGREILFAVKVGEERGADLNGMLARITNVAGTTRYWHVLEGFVPLLDA